MITKRRTYYARCPECDAYPAYCKNCGAKTTGSTPFSDYLRDLDAPFNSQFFDNENLDYIWFQYHEGWFITIEEKMWGKESTLAQQDTHNVMAQLLTLGADSDPPIKTMRGIRKIEYRGHYEISFENTIPDDSKWIRINGIQLDISEIFNLLRKGYLPDVPDGKDILTKEEIKEWKKKRDGLPQYSGNLNR